MGAASHSWGAVKLRLKTRVSFRGNLATVMSPWPEGQQRPYQAGFIQTLFGVCGSWVISGMEFDQFEIGLQKVHGHVVAAICNADLNTEIQ